jgi:hypothetical protein
MLSREEREIEEHVRKAGLELERALRRMQAIASSTSTALGYGNQIIGALTEARAAVYYVERMLR